jgi:hypothetical protein
VQLRIPPTCLLILFVAACGGGEAPEPPDAIPVLRVEVLGIAPTEDEALAAVQAGFRPEGPIHAWLSVPAVGLLPPATVPWSDALCVDFDDTPMSWCSDVLLQIEPGHYVLQEMTLDDAAYVEASPWRFYTAATVDDGVADGSAAIALPWSPYVALPPEQPVGAPLAIDLRNQGYASAGVAVLDEAGNRLWSNEAVGPAALARVAAQEPVGIVTIPGEAFADPGRVAVGVAGMVEASPADFDVYQPPESGIRAGEMVFAWLPVSN